MIKKRLIRGGALALCAAVTLGCAPALAGCTGSSKDTITIMSEELSGLYNPFYATSGADQDVIGYTQLGMLTYDADDDGDVEIACGEDYATVCLAYDESVSDDNSETVYTFVIKNGIKFSDGEPLTMNDVFFNLYEYLDPVYTGSSTMYSVKIKGLSQYRTQKNLSDNTDTEDAISSSAATYARTRREELIYIYETNGEQSDNSYELNETAMKAAIEDWDVSDGYKEAVALEGQTVDYKAQLVEDYEFTLTTFKEELESDLTAAKESFDFTTAPYKDWTQYKDNDLFKFFLYEGYITPVYEKVSGKDNKEKIEKFEGTNILSTYTTTEAAINKVYNDTVTYNFNQILTSWGTAGTVLTEFTADATEIVIKNSMENTSSLTYPNISGIVSLGHTTSTQSVTIKGNTYKVAQSHNADGTPKNSDEYDVLQITTEGVDPKAIYNFGFSVAPAHYYTADSDHPDGRTIDIANNQFGVEYASSSFQSKVIKSSEHNKVPVGAGAYMATNRNNDDTTTGNEFVSGNIVYYKANPYFAESLGEQFEQQTEKIRLQVVSSSDALDMLQSGDVDFVTPQFTKENADVVDTLVKTGDYEKLSSWQLGYGYIGINAGKVSNVYIRRAIMAAMETSLSLEYYQSGTVKTIDWPMSMMSWAYPWQSSDHTPETGTSKSNGKSYTQWTSKAAAITKIKELMNEAGVTAGEDSLKITFTIAGASITEHPTYNVFKQAAEILSGLGWQITVRADSQALTKLSTGSLEVWAAAWGSTIDPDMYQVYHKNSTATSVYAWGYREIKADTTTYSYEYSVINELSDVIDAARETLNKEERKTLYEEAMGYVLDLAVELPVYQRQNLYVYSSRISGFPETVNAYTSPLEEIWKLKVN